MIEIFLPGEFTSLNDYIDAERGNKFKAAQIKKDETHRVKFESLGKLPVDEYPVEIEFHWQCKDQKKDPDNIAFAKKFILDGLVASHVLAGDGWKHITGFSDRFILNAKDPGVTVVIRASGMRYQHEAVLVTTSIDMGGVERKDDGEGSVFDEPA